MNGRAREGQWVQVHSIILQPGERAPQVPEDTQAAPLEMWVKGFATHDASMGEQVQVRTTTGRLETGELVAIEPAYPHGFGRPVPELLTIGQELRQLLNKEGSK